MCTQSFILFTVLLNKSPKKNALIRKEVTAVNSHINFYIFLFPTLSITDTICQFRVSCTMRCTSILIGKYDITSFSKNIITIFFSHYFRLYRSIQDSGIRMDLPSAKNEISNKNLLEKTYMLIVA